MNNKKKRILWIALGIVCCFILKTSPVLAEEKKAITTSIEITDGEQDYGSIYGSEYSEMDESKWLTVQMKGRGLRVINEEGEDIILVDQFGAVYINGQRVDVSSDNSTTVDRGHPSYGFLYFLIIIALILSIYNFFTRKRKTT